LRFDLRQVGLPSEVPTAQVATQQPQQVDRIARPIALFRMRAIAPTFEQRQQHLLRSVIPMFRFQLPKHWSADQTFLRLPHVAYGLRLDEWLLNEPKRLAARTLVADLPVQYARHILDPSRSQ